MLVVYHISDPIQCKSLEDLPPVEINTVMTRIKCPTFNRGGPEMLSAELKHYFTKQNIKSEEILPRGPRPNFKYTNTVLKREMVNRLSLPDGQIIRRLF
ncbi:hypothetical protein Smp_061930 [Schistosoma mansoni]|uniref:hypothetical protein n=1 Tax=Schistosoma mansoni TaxID=6183 RepID=UPI0001A637F7|nr:hypothetical protein Smp_061930 [Schistosoma mansoni]|eukprot:XP_018654766.1 hypothetical protein Smp_061930 [Schistosoma mansoni]